MAQCLQSYFRVLTWITQYYVSTVLCSVFISLPMRQMLNSLLDKNIKKYFSSHLISTHVVQVHISYSHCSLYLCSKLSLKLPSYNYLKNALPQAQLYHWSSLLWNYQLNLKLLNLLYFNLKHSNLLHNSFIARWFEIGISGERPIRKLPPVFWLYLQL